MINPATIIKTFAGIADWGYNLGWSIGGGDWEDVAWKETEVNKKEYKLLFKNAFRFLVTDYNFKIVSTKTDNWGISILAKNLTTGVKITDEIRESYIHIMLYKLIDGEIVENTASALKNNEPINGFDLGWIIRLKNPEAQIKPTYEYGDGSPFHDEKNGKKNYVEFVAGGLKEYAGDILSGDFSTFSALDKMVKEHYKTTG